MKKEETKLFPKDALKQKSVPFYKSFLFIKEDEDMQVNINIDLLSFTPEDALRFQIMSADPVKFFEWYANKFDDHSIDEFIENGRLVNMPEMLEVNMHGVQVPFSVLTVPSSELMEKDLVDAGDIYQQDGALSITLKGKDDLTVNLLTKEVESFNMLFDTATGNVTGIEDIKLEDPKE